MKAAPVIVIFRTGQLGDTLVALPSLYALRKKYPSHRLVLLTERQPVRAGYVSSWELLRPTNWFEQVIWYDARGRGIAKIRMLLGLVAELRRLQVKHFFNLAPDRSNRQRRMDVLFFRLLAGIRAYHPPPPDRRMGTQPNPNTRLLPEWRYLFDAVGGRQEDLNGFHLPIAQDEREIAGRIAAESGLDLNSPLLAIGPGSKMAAKRWPLERFAELGERLRQEFPAVRFVVLGGSEDATAGEHLCGGWGKGSGSLAGKLSIHGSAAILERCLGYIGNDSGTMHLAGVSGVRSVALFSARDYPGKWNPYGSGHRVLRRAVPCAGCMLEVCTEHANRCLTDLTVDEVLAAARDVLRTSDQGRPI